MLIRGNSRPDNPEPSKPIYLYEVQVDIKFYYETTALTIQQIANKLNLPFSMVYKHIRRDYSSEYRKNRKVVCYRNSKLGSNNPMFGLRGEETHNYIGDVADCKGYLMRVKPAWYTGRKRSRHVFTHHIVVCEQLGITEVPRGWCVHHCDFDPHNNSFDNLVLLTLGDHTRLHRALEGVTTIPKGSTLEWVETHGTPWRDDIV